MRMLVVGAGSTGGYFGGRLAQAGRDVTFLVRPARAAQLAERGLQILSPHGDFTLRPQFVTADRISDSYDAILLTVKAFSLESALADMAPAVGPETMILPVWPGPWMTRDESFSTIQFRISLTARWAARCPRASKDSIASCAMQDSMLVFLRL